MRPRWRPLARLGEGALGGATLALALSGKVLISQQSEENLYEQVGAKAFTHILSRGCGAGKGRPCEALQVV